MKTKLTVFFIFLSLYSYAQTRKITGFMGFPFGSPSKIVVDSLSKRGKIMQDGLSKAGMYNFKEMNVSGRKTYFVSVGFTEDKLYMGGVFFIIDGVQNSIDTFNAISNSISDLYGNPQNRVREFKYPYKETDPEAWVAVKGGYATIMNFWEIEGNRIELSISSKGEYVILSYKDGILFEKVKEKGKSKSDY